MRVLECFCENARVFSVTVLECFFYIGVEFTLYLFEPNRLLTQDTSDNRKPNMSCIYSTNVWGNFQCSLISLIWLTVKSTMS